MNYNNYIEEDAVVAAGIVVYFIICCGSSIVYSRYFGELFDFNRCSKLAWGTGVDANKFIEYSNKSVNF